MFPRAGFRPFKLSFNPLRLKHFSPRKFNAVGLTLGSFVVWNQRSNPLQLDVNNNSITSKLPPIESKPVTLKSNHVPVLWEASGPFGLIRLGFRAISLGLLLTPLISLFPIWFLFGGNWFLVLATKTCEVGGPIFIKLCQWASMRQDLFPVSVCTAFARLQSHSPAHSFKQTVETVEEMLNDPKNGFVDSNSEKAAKLSIGDVFDSFDSAPVGVGAVAQVHRATLKSEFIATFSTNKTDVAVKVLHPHIKPLIEMDLILLQAWGKLISWILPGSRYLAVNEELATFADMMRRQTDLTLEFDNLVTETKKSAIQEEFEETKPGEVMLPVSFPTPLFGNANVLVEQYCEGIAFTKITELGNCAFDDELIMIGLPAFVRMIMKHNFVHADLHAGNILLTFKKSSPKNRNQKDQAPITWIDPSIYQTLSTSTVSERKQILQDLKTQGFTPHCVFLDVGLTSSLSAKNLENIQVVVAAALEGNGSQMADLFMTRCRNPEAVVHHELARATMRKMIQDIGMDESVRGGSKGGAVLPLSKLKSAEVLRRVADFFRYHRIGLEGDWVGLFVAAVLVEGIARKLGGDVDVLEVLLEEVPETMSF